MTGNSIVQHLCGAPNLPHFSASRHVSVFGPGRHDVTWHSCCNPIYLAFAATSSAAFSQAPARRCEFAVNMFRPFFVPLSRATLFKLIGIQGNHTFRYSSQQQCSELCRCDQNLRHSHLIYLETLSENDDHNDFCFIANFLLNIINLIVELLLIQINT